MVTDFIGKVVVITGGSGCIGSALVRSYHSAGAIVYFTYYSNVNSAESLLKELSSSTVDGQRVDSKNKNEIQNFIDRVGCKHKHIDILINNAGILTNSILFDQDNDSWDETLSVNLTGVRNYCNSSLRYLSKSPDGASIINITSISADRPMVGMSAYSASKSAVESLSKVIAIEYAPYGIRVNTVAPGLIDTDMAKLFSEKIRKKIISRTPLKRLGTVTDVINSVHFLSNNKLSSFITGSQLYITGGKHLD